MKKERKSNVILRSTANDFNQMLTKATYRKTKHSANQRVV